MTKQEKKDRDEARAMLREILKPGDRLYTVSRHVSRSGMYRALDVYAISADGARRLSWSVARAIGYRYDKRHEAIGVTGCGLDVGFAVVYDLGAALFPDGFGCIGEPDGGPRCQSNDHSNGDRDYTPHSEGRPHWHREGGYSLRHAWM